MSKKGINIIGGKHRGKKLIVPDAKDLRPTPNLVRETLFNWLQSEIQGLHTLDLFAGSGLLSFEAISRGAGSATLIEKNPKVFQTLKNNSAYFQEGNIKLHCIDALTYIKKNKLTEFQLIFIDAPFSSNLLFQALTLLNGKVANGCLVYIEHGQALDDLPIATVRLKQKKAGQVVFELHQVITGDHS